MEKNKVCSPTRVDIVGGLLDIWPIYTFIEDCFIVNFSIPVFTSVEWGQGQKIYEKKKKSIKSSHKTNLPIQIKISSPAHNYENSFSNIKDLLEESKQELSLLQAHLKYWMNFLKEDKKNNSFFTEEKSFSLCLNSQSPIGAGLGGSSSLCVSLSKVFCSLFHQSLTASELIMLCRDIEASLLHAPAGIQDYIPAIESKENELYIIQNTPFAPQWKKQEVPLDFFKDHFLLIDTGKSHHSGNNNWEILKKAVEKDQDILKALCLLRDNALNVVHLCKEERWDDLPVYLEKENNLRQKYFSNWSPSSVSSLMELMKKEGADVVKLCGAGGGGCLLVFAKSKAHKESLKKVCQRNKISIVVEW